MRDDGWLEHETARLVSGKSNLLVPVIEAVLTKELTGYKVASPTTRPSDLLSDTNSCTSVTDLENL